MSEPRKLIPPSWGPVRRYERPQFWYYSKVWEDWISLPLKDVAPSDIEFLHRSGTWADAILGVGVRQR